MIDVHVEAAELDDGIPMMYRDGDRSVRMAFDPQQISEARALALLCVRMPRLVGSLAIRRQG